MSLQSLFHQQNSQTLPLPLITFLAIFFFADFFAFFFAIEITDDFIEVLIFKAIGLKFEFGNYILMQSQQKNKT